ISKKTARFEMDLATELPKVRGNSQRISQVLINLLVNSCEALTDRNQSILLSSRFNTKDQVVEIEVRDEGVGIAEEHFKKITDPFSLLNGPVEAPVWACPYHLQLCRNMAVGWSFQLIPAGGPLQNFQFR
ncbi:PocR ligand-binding domain-containing protein, partial [Aduncisulcus paluster]